jgi:hypothetical protein
MIKNITSILVVATFVMQLVFLYLLVNPINVTNQLESVKIINEAVKLNNLPINELPQIGVIGDKKMLADIETIKKTNTIDAEVYKDGANGDYVLGYSNRLVIYRPSTKKIVYDGQSPQQKLAATQKNIVTDVLKKIADAKLIPADYNQVPQMSIVTNPDEQKKSNDFYKDVLKDDILVTFTNPNLLVIFRPSTNAIVKSGQIQVSIK